MPGEGSITGVIGRITWSYYTAAQIEGYTVRRSPSNEWTLCAVVVLSDSFKIRQRPLMFRAVRKLGGTMGEWVWPIVEFTSDPKSKGEITARLGPPIE